jgi:hypothetical protein
MRTIPHIHSGPGDAPKFPWLGILFAVASAFVSYLILPR